MASLVFGLLPGWVWMLLAAPFAGSFLGLLAIRLPAGRPVAIARSACDHCGTVLGARELVPLLSYAIQRGRCRHCLGTVDAVHPLMEVGCLIIAGWAACLISGPALYASCLLGWVLLALAVADWRSFLLPDPLTLPLLLLGLGVTEWLTPWDLADHAIAAILGYAIFRGLALAYRRLRGRDGLGQGDAKLLAVAGAWVGLMALPYVILIGALFGIGLAAARKLLGETVTAATAVPFGPGLALGLWLVWLYS